jgi:hypothetical protein
MLAEKHVGQVGVIVVFFALSGQNDLIARRNHLGVHHACFRATQTGIRPFDAHHFDHVDLVDRDIQLLGEIVFCEIGQPRFDVDLTPGLGRERRSRLLAIDDWSV